jgi:hypothetical protein
MADAFQRADGAAGNKSRDTIEIELSAEQALELSRARTGTPSRRRARIAMVFGVVGIAFLVSGIAFVAPKRMQPVEAVAESDSTPAATGASTALPSVEAPPVRYANPFDATEVFEFPAGTSPVEARDAVAEMLLQRARDRALSSEMRDARPGRSPN